MDSNESQHSPVQQLAQGVVSDYIQAGVTEAELQTQDAGAKIASENGEPVTVESEDTGTVGQDDLPVEASGGSREHGHGSTQRRATPEPQAEIPSSIQASYESESDLHSLDSGHEASTEDDSRWVRPRINRSKFARLAAAGRQRRPAPPVQPVRLRPHLSRSKLGEKESKHQRKGKPRPKPLFKRLEEQYKSRLEDEDKKKRAAYNIQKEKWNFKSPTKEELQLHEREYLERKRQIEDASHHAALEREQQWKNTAKTASERYKNRIRKSVILNDRQAHDISAAKKEAVIERVNRRKIYAKKMKEGSSDEEEVDVRSLEKAYRGLNKSELQNHEREYMERKRRMSAASQHAAEERKLQWKNNRKRAASRYDNKIRSSVLSEDKRAQDVSTSKKEEVQERMNRRKEYGKKFKQLPPGVSPRDPSARETDLTEANAHGAKGARVRDPTATANSNNAMARAPNARGPKVTNDSQNSPRTKLKPHPPPGSVSPDKRPLKDNHRIVSESKSQDQPVIRR